METKTNPQLQELIKQVSELKEAVQNLPSSNQQLVDLGPKIGQVQTAIKDKDVSGIAIAEKLDALILKLDVIATGIKPIDLSIIANAINKPSWQVVALTFSGSLLGVLTGVFIAWYSSKNAKKENDRQKDIRDKELKVQRAIDAAQLGTQIKHEKAIEKNRIQREYIEKELINLFGFYRMLVEEQENRTERTQETKKTTSKNVRLLAAYQNGYALSPKYDLNIKDCQTHWTSYLAVDNEVIEYKQNAFSEGDVYGENRSEEFREKRNVALTAYEKALEDLMNKVNAKLDELNNKYIALNAM